MKWLAIGLAVLCTACAINSGAIPLGSGAYMVTVENNWLTGGVGGAARRATETAREACGSREVVPISNEVIPEQPYRSSSFTFNFRCS